MIPADIAAVVAALHAAPQRLVLAFAGAGSLALFWLHALPGSSRTLLEAVDCYSPHSLRDWLGGAPQQSVSAAVAEGMARRALARAAHLAEQDWPLLGVSCTAAIATDRTRRGADQAFVAVAAPAAVHSYHVMLAKESHDRSSEEALISRLMVYAMAGACDLNVVPQLPLRTGDRLES